MSSCSSGDLSPRDGGLSARLFDALTPADVAAHTTVATTEAKTAATSSNLKRKAPGIYSRNIISLVL
jgi:hypothetical protein